LTSEEAPTEKTPDESPCRYLCTSNSLPPSTPLDEALELLVLSDEYLCVTLRSMCEHFIGSRLELEHLPAALDLTSTFGLGVLESYCRLLITHCEDATIRELYGALGASDGVEAEALAAQVASSAALGEKSSLELLVCDFKNLLQTGEEMHWAWTD
jgi:hypothetical protein